jgi:methionyl-tRNA formyltransferase
MNPWPGAQTRFDNLDAKIIAVEPNPLPIRRSKIGQLFLYEDKLAVQTGDGALVILLIQPAGKKPLNAKSFINGYQRLINI